MKTMKMKQMVLGVLVVLIGLIPFTDVDARGYASGYHGGRGGSGYAGGHWGGYHGRWGGYHGRWGGYPRYWGGYPRYWGGYPRYWGGGCWNCGAASAAIVGLGLGTVLGTAIANTPPPPPPVVVEPSAPTTLDGCSSVVVNGITYYNCEGSYPWRYDGSGGTETEGWQNK